MPLAALGEALCSVVQRSPCTEKKATNQQLPGCPPALAGTTELLHLNPDLGDGMQLKVGTRIKIPPWNDACPKLTPSPINPGGSGGSGGSGSGKPSGSNSPAPGNSPPHMALPFPFLSPSPVPVLPSE